RRWQCRPVLPSLSVPCGRPADFMTGQPRRYRMQHLGEGEIARLGPVGSEPQAAQVQRLTTGQQPLPGLAAIRAEVDAAVLCAGVASKAGPEEDVVWVLRVHYYGVDAGLHLLGQAIG